MNVTFLGIDSRLFADFYFITQKLAQTIYNFLKVSRIYYRYRHRSSC